MENTHYRIERIISGTPEYITPLNTLMKQLKPSIKEITLEDLVHMVSDKNTYIYVVKDVQQNIVGTLTLIIFQSPGGRRGYIEELVVDEGQRGKGLGKKLLNEAIKQSQELGVDYIGLTSRPDRVAANHLYQTLGFQKRDTNVYRLILRS